MCLQLNYTVEVLVFLPDGGGGVVPLCLGNCCPCGGSVESVEPVWLVEMFKVFPEPSSLESTLDLLESLVFDDDVPPIT